MIKYHYNLIEDIKAQLDMLRDIRGHKKRGLVLFYPNPWETLKIALKWTLFKRPVIKYQCEKNINCYFVSGGVWGSYFPSTNKIHICPRKAAHEFLEDIIKHEIAHLEYDKDVQGMSHQEKEEYINSKTRKQSD